MAKKTEQLTVTKRTETGTKRMRRLRAAGSIPAVLYGHGEGTIAISVLSEQIDAAFRHGSQLVDLTGELDESALITDVQWDTFGTEPLHIDFTRVSKTEKVDVTVSLEQRGVAPGVREGGVVIQSLHELEINCPAIAIPDSIEVNINHLELEGEILASALELPEGATLLIPEDQVIVHCVIPQEEPEEDEEGALGEGAEPEVIGEKKDDDEDDDS